MIVAESDRLILRHVKRVDAGSLAAVFGDPDVMRFGDGPQTIDWIHSWIARTMQNYDILGYGAWVVTQFGNADAIGYCGLTRFLDINGKPETEIGFRLAREHWNRGYATEAATMVRELAFNQLDLSRLIALIDPANTRSIRVAEKLGMTYDGEVMLPGYNHPDSVYVCSRGETFQQVDCSSLPSDDASFDRVFSNALSRPARWR